MTEAEVRELCAKFFDAYENRDVAEVAKLYAPDCVIWNNVFDHTMTGAENVEKLPAGYLRQRRRIYNDRIVLSHASRWDTEVVAGWCYTPRGSGAAYLAAVLWDPRETDRPEGFVKEAFDAR